VQGRRGLDINGRQLLDRWGEQGLIRRDRADRICGDESWAPLPARSKTPVPHARRAALSSSRRWGTWAAYSSWSLPPWLSTAAALAIAAGTAVAVILAALLAGWLTPVALGRHRSG
jgi:hypothetical protein